MRPTPLHFRGVTLDFHRPYLVGVVNVTPDSFSAGGRHLDATAAVAHGRALVAAGADWLDVGGESTRPGASPVAAEEEIRRVVPVIEGLAGLTATVLSIDTTKAQVARAALAAGAEVVNDVSGGRFDPAVLEVAERAGAVLVLGHLRGHSVAEVHAREREPLDFEAVAAELAALLAALPAGLRARAVADPGLGFGKPAALNLELLRRSGELGDRLSCAVMVGPSRKRFLGELTGLAVDQRDAATVGAALAAAAAGAHLLRIHDVASVAAALAVFRAVTGGEGGA